MNTLNLYSRTAQNTVCAFLAAFTVTVMLSLGTAGIEAMTPDVHGIITIAEA